MGIEDDIKVEEQAKSFMAKEPEEREKLLYIAVIRTDALLAKILAGDCPTGLLNRQEIEVVKKRIGKLEVVIGKAVAIGIGIAGGSIGLGKLFEAML